MKCDHERRQPVARVGWGSELHAYVAIARSLMHGCDCILAGIAVVGEAV